MGSLVTGGGPDNDSIQLVQTVVDGVTLVTVFVNGIDLGSFEVEGKIFADGQARDDTIQVDSAITLDANLSGGSGNDVLQDIEVDGSISLDAFFEGGAGDDRLKRGAGDDILFGGAGDDLMLSQSGRDLLIGGSGADRIVGNADDDILIAGYLAFADNQAAALDIMAEWTSARDYQTRIENISGLGTGSRANGETYLKTDGEDATIHDDNVRDKLTGSSGEDWFFLDPDLDKATDLKDEVFANDLDWILNE